jgi:AraC family transcriptional regulator of adaptative response / methylphosphotriester-DNA alkyltransferase methyltransferase
MMSGYAPSGVAPRPSLILRGHPIRRPDVSIQRSTTIRLRTALYADSREIVEAEYGEDLSLDEIARRVASSRRQLQRAYAEVGHTTFREQLTQVRMQRAAEMLSARRLTVREVAHRVGYRQPAQFAKAFRRAYGMAPSDFRHEGVAPRDISAPQDGALTAAAAA